MQKAKQNSELTKFSLFFFEISEKLQKIYQKIDYQFSAFFAAI